MNDATPNPPPAPTSKPLLLPLGLGILPAAMVLALIGIASVSSSNDLPTALFVLVCFASVVCCFVSSFMLFRRKTLPAMLGGICLILLNGFIALVSGCAALLNNAFH